MAETISISVIYDIDVRCLRHLASPICAIPSLIYIVAHKHKIARTIKYRQPIVGQHITRMVQTGTERVDFSIVGHRNKDIGNPQYRIFARIAYRSLIRRRGTRLCLCDRLCLNHSFVHHLSRHRVLHFGRNRGYRLWNHLRYNRGICNLSGGLHLLCRRRHDRLRFNRLINTRSNLFSLFDRQFSP